MLAQIFVHVLCLVAGERGVLSIVIPFLSCCTRKRERGQGTKGDREQRVGRKRECHAMILISLSTGSRDKKSLYTSLLERLFVCLSQNPT